MWAACDDDIISFHHTSDKDQWGTKLFLMFKSSGSEGIYVDYCGTIHVPSLPPVWRGKRILRIIDSKKYSIERNTLKEYPRLKVI